MPEGLSLSERMQKLGEVGSRDLVSEVSCRGVLVAAGLLLMEAEE